MNCRRHGANCMAQGRNLQKTDYNLRRTQTTAVAVARSTHALFCKAAATRCQKRRVDEKGDYMPRKLVTTLFVVSLLYAVSSAQEKPFPAHKIVGNVYYVGSDALAIYLITTADGHILINSGFEETVPLIEKSVKSLGFKVSDVKIMLASHAHADHVAGHARLQKLTGAKVYVMRGDHSVIDRKSVV